MRFSTIGGAQLLALAACFFPSCIAAGAYDRPSTFIPGRYIVEFEDENTVRFQISTKYEAKL
jgi:hypothetical protein